MLRLMAGLGIDAADIGMPGSGPVAYGAVLALAGAVAREGLPIALNCAARTVEEDIRPIAEISAATGVPIEVMAFIGASPVRLHAEGWSVERVTAEVAASVRFAVAQGLPVCLVTEDTTRSRPELLAALYRTALDEGATRLCAADTVGHATPEGTARLVSWLRTELIDRHGFTGTPLDWHGHNDRGLALANSLAALEAGADRVHGTALGIGERCGNTAMEQILLNLHLRHAPRDLTTLAAYCARAAEVFGRPIRDDDPVIGHDAFRTGTGVHAAAISKAPDDRTAGLVYSAVPAADLGRSQQVVVGPVSGRWNLRNWLRSHGLPEDPGCLDRLVEMAQHSDGPLSDAALLALVAEHGGQAVPGRTR
ncbi:hypothetical protein GCM10010468_00820 [Actinocorallia longicatena]|uniref:2-isopropylmalate synthase n=1 Tax=Actinocorallia longicatena TaxID=111803 RepID=A0ABP6PXV8_9ACTN